jgi:hypothetical protein
LGSLELNDFLAAIERDGDFKIHLDVLARVPDRGFGAEKFIEVFALDVLSIHQAIDSDAKRESHHCGTRKPAGVTPQTPAGGWCVEAQSVGGIVELAVRCSAVFFARLAVVDDKVSEIVFLHQPPLIGRKFGAGVEGQ